MKLLDFTGRKVDPSIMMGFKEEKKEKDPNVKVLLRRFSSIIVNTQFVSDISSI